MNGVDFMVLVPIIAVIMALGLPIVVMVMFFISVMKKDRQKKEIRQMIIENNVDPETAKLLIDEPKKQRKVGPLDLGTLRTACILLGAGLGALITALVDTPANGYYFWLIIAFGIGVGLLCSFLVEMHLFKKYGKNGADDEKEGLQEAE